MAQVILNPSADTRLLFAAPTTNYSTDLVIDAGNNGGTDTRTSLVKFDLSSLSGKIITGATLRLYDEGGNYASNVRTMSVFRLLRNWVNAQATWNVWSTGNNWSVAGAMGYSNDCESSGIGSISLPTPAVAGYVDITLTTAKVQEWIDGGLANYGLVMIMATNSSDMHEFTSGEGTNKPQLVITYPSSSGFFALL